MRKPQSQPALTSLGPEDRLLLASWLRSDSYDAVLARVKKSRSEGGFDLHISKRPLQTFYAKVALLDLINSRLGDDKKMGITEFESLSAGILPDSEFSSSPPLDEISHSEIRNPPCSTIHEAILETARDLVHSGDNTPAQLLALQRLADFPARAEFRAHKLQMDLENAARKKEMDAHRKHMAEERLALQKRALELRERQLASRAGSAPVPGAVLGVPPSTSSSDSIHCTRPFTDPDPSPERHQNSRFANGHSRLSDHLGPYATTLDEIEARAMKKFGLKHKPGAASNVPPNNLADAPPAHLLTEALPDAINNGHPVSTQPPEITSSNLNAPCPVRSADCQSAPSSEPQNLRTSEPQNLRTLEP